MALEKNQCTSDLSEVIGHIISYFSSKDYELAKKISELAFSLNENESHTSFQIKCYTTGGNLNDIRFCIDRGNDCSKSRKNTAFLIIRKGCEIHVRDSGERYIKSQANTDFSIINGSDARIIGFEKIKHHMLRSFCKMVNNLGLSSDLCVL